MSWEVDFPAQNGMRQFMRAGRPYCLAHGGNVAAGRHAKTPKVNGVNATIFDRFSPFLMSAIHQPG
ncbi:hypothetical protein [Symbiopectobacterium purcellii]|uniref:hypothetical protein n=1 Tax=Symbiopectobacterium purcellii TaxID=2871826 RepID=UPI003F835A76